MDEEPLANRWLPLPRAVAGPGRRRAAKARPAPSDPESLAPGDDLPDDPPPAPTRLGIRCNDGGEGSSTQGPSSPSKIVDPLPTKAQATTPPVGLLVP